MSNISSITTNQCEGIVSLLKRLPNELLFRIFFILPHSYLPDVLLQNNYFMNRWYKTYYPHHYNQWKRENNINWRVYSINNTKVEWISQDNIFTTEIKHDEILITYGRTRAFLDDHNRSCIEHRSKDQKRKDRYSLISDEDDNIYILRKVTIDKDYIERVYDINTEEIIRISARNITSSYSFTLKKKDIIRVKIIDYALNGRQKRSHIISVDNQHVLNVVRSKFQHYVNEPLWI